MIEALLYSFFGCIVGASLYAVRKTNSKDERHFAIAVALVVILLIIATSWQMSTTKRENFERQLLQSEEEAYEMGYEAGLCDGYDECKHNALRRGAEYMTEDELNEFEWYLE